MPNLLKNVTAEPPQMPAACPLCGGAGCAKCSQTGQAEFCGSLTAAELEQAFGTRRTWSERSLKASDLRGLARSEEDIGRLLARADGLVSGWKRFGNEHRYATGVAAAIRWLTGEVDDPPIPFNAN